MIVAGGADTERGGDEKTGETRSAEIRSQINRDLRSGHNLCIGDPDIEVRRRSVVEKYPKVR